MRLVHLALLALLTPTLAKADYGAHVGGHFGYGKMGNSSLDANQSRGIGTFDLQGMPGIKVYGKFILLGLMLDYRFHSQLSDDNSLSQYGGRSFLLGPGAILDFPLFKLLFSWDIRDRHYYSGPDTTYKGSGFHFLFGYKVVGNLCVDLEYVTARYKSVKINDDEIGLDDPVKHYNLAFGLSWSF